jgi:hypothetical protein
MFRFTIRELMLVTTVVALAFAADRQILWLKARSEYSKCVALNDELLQFGTQTFIPYPPGENPNIRYPKWRTRADLVRELETITQAARSLEGTVKGWREKRRAWEKAGEPAVWGM